MKSASFQTGFFRRKPASAKRNEGFTLLEVMIAAGILFLCLFAILELLSTSLRNARVLQRTKVDAGMLAAELSLTNKLSEGTTSGDFGKLYPDYRWSREIREASTNGLFEVHWEVYRRGTQGAESQMSILLFKPESTRVGVMNRF
jgi:type II secretory pathway component PulJ